MTISFNVDSVSTVSPKSRIGRPNALIRAAFDNSLVKIGLGGRIMGSEVNLPSPQIDYVNPDRNGFLETWTRAYNEHVPMIVGPDEVWLAFCQAVVTHIKLDPEAVRGAMGVTHENKKDIVLDIDANPDWKDVFSSFSDVLESHVGKKRDLFDPTFSTTSHIEKAATQIQLMDTFSAYFTYYARTRCGFPSIHLLGTVDDWKGIQSRVAALGEIVPDWIHKPMMYVADQFLESAAGKVDRTFWKNFLKVYGGSGGPYVSGFINAFFPYVSKKYKNDLLDPEHFNKRGVGNFQERILRVGGMEGANPEDIHGSVCSVPVTWFRLGQVIKMKFAAGIVGVGIDEQTIPGGGYRCAIGWTVGCIDPDELPDAA